MFPELSNIAKKNENSLDKLSEFRTAIQQPGARRIALFNQYRGQYPYFGYVPVRETDVPYFYMFNNNDDIVAQHYIWFGLNAYETETMKLWKALCSKSRQILDVGAFTGLFSLVARRISADARVIAIEPLSPMYERLMINLRVNRLFRNVEHHKIGFGRKSGKKDFLYFRPTGILQTGASYVHKANREINYTEVAHVVTGDRFCHDNALAPDLIKIDVEEAEADVVHGLGKTLAKLRPHVICELSPNTARHVLTFFAELGYGAVLIDDHRRSLRPIQNDQEITRVLNVYFDPSGNMPQPPAVR